MTGIAEGIAGNAIWHGMIAFLRRIFGRGIQITSPRVGELLTGKKSLGSASFSYEVKGTLKCLPKNHEIWLLVREERSSRVWPQGFERVVYNDRERSWTGRVTAQQEDVTIIATVAPPTSRDFFRYFQKVGNLRGAYEPLDSIPAECRNTHEVQAKKTKLDSGHALKS